MESHNKYVGIFSTRLLRALFKLQIVMAGKGSSVTNVETGLIPTMIGILAHL